MQGETVDEFQEQRGRLFGIAYRMLGTATDAVTALDMVVNPEKLAFAERKGEPS